MSELLTARDINQAIREGKAVIAYMPDYNCEVPVASARVSLYNKALQVNFVGNGIFYDVEPRMVRIVGEK